MDSSPTKQGLSPTAGGTTEVDDRYVIEQDPTPVPAVDAAAGERLAVEHDPLPGYILERKLVVRLLCRAMQGFLQELSIKGASPNTIDAYRRDLRQFGATCSELFVHQVSRERIRLYLKEVRRGNVPSDLKHARKPEAATNRSMARKLSCLRSFFRWALLLNHVVHDPTMGVRNPRLPKSLPYPLTKPEAKQIVETRPKTNNRALALRNTAILETLYATGVRASELTGLDLRDLDMGQGMLKVMGKGGKERLVPVGRASQAALQLYLRDGRPRLAGGAGVGEKSALFLNKDGGRLTRRSLQRVVASVAAEVATLDRLHPHTWRHTFATHLLEGGADLRSVQELLGHASVRSTQIYTKVTSDHLKAEYKHHPRDLGRDTEPCDPGGGRS